MNHFATAARPHALLLSLTVLLASACGSGPADPAASATMPAATVADEDDDYSDDAGLGSGALDFHLAPDTTLPLPVTFCAGQGTILTIAAREGETQVDLRVIELPTLRDGAPLEEVTEAGYRFTGEDQGRVFQEVWQSKAIDNVVRDQDTTRVSGTMYGLRMYDKGNGAFTSPEPIDDGAHHAFTISVTCSL
ncbi:hypothetical protein [Arenimonas alkanexedens]